MTKLQEKLKTLSSLPALPTTVTRLIRSLSGTTSGASDLEEIIKTDEALSAAVLKFANSVAHGATGRVFTLQESIARLGNRALHRIAVSQRCNTFLVRTENGLNLTGAHWTFALGGGLAAEILAADTKVADAGVCFVAGLLRDIGTLAIEKLLGPEELEKALSSRIPGQDALTAERKAFGLDHAEIGAQLARQWGLPDDISNAICGHHGPTEKPEFDDPITHVVHCGDLIGVWMGLGSSDEAYIWSYPRCEESMELCGLSRENADGYIEEVKKQMALLAPS
ncbi:MAG: HDOD domain-containing protein [Planctomycetota bacterium]